MDQTGFAESYPLVSKCSDWIRSSLRGHSEITCLSDSGSAEEFINIPTKTTQLLRRLVYSGTIKHFQARNQWLFQTYTLPVGHALWSVRLQRREALFSSSLGCCLLRDRSLKFGSPLRRLSMPLSSISFCPTVSYHSYSHIILWAAQVLGQSPLRLRSQFYCFLCHRR